MKAELKNLMIQLENSGECLTYRMGQEEETVSVLKDKVEGRDHTKNMKLKIYKETSRKCRTP